MLLKIITGLELELDLDNKLLKVSDVFAHLMIRASKMNFPDQNHFIFLVAEKETLKDIVENSWFV